MFVVVVCVVLFVVMVCSSCSNLFQCVCVVLVCFGCCVLSLV